MLARIGQLFRMRQAFRIKYAAPRRKCPATDPNVDFASGLGHCARLLRNQSCATILVRKRCRAARLRRMTATIELVTPDVRAPLHSWSFAFSGRERSGRLQFGRAPR